MRLKGKRTAHVPGWSGGVLEGAEPDVARPRGYGSLADGLNIRTAPLGRLAVRGGSRVVQTFALDTVSEVLGVWPFSPTGSIAIAYDATEETHYAYALTDTLQFALPVGSETETGSRVDLGTEWETATPGRPVCVELFETLYVVDATAVSPRPLVALRVVAGTLTLVEPTYELNNGGTDPAYPFCAAVYNSALFVAGWMDETQPSAPHILRNSLIGTDPADPTGFDPDGYALIGAHGQRITAMEPGREILMVAKQSELYRVFGTGQALPGWHYAIQQVENTQGYGVSNPYAFKHINGYWYGIGQSGPFRTNGAVVEPLGVPWRESWARMDMIDKAWVAYNPTPERRTAWFGFHETGFDYPDAPFSIWQWDVDRETWCPPHRYPRAFHMVNSIVPGTTDAPTGAPIGLAQRTTVGSMGLTWVEVRWAYVDHDAEVEVWVRTDGPYTLHQTVPMGIQRAVIPGLQGQKLQVKVRHIRGGVPGPFSEVVPVYTRLPGPYVGFLVPYGASGSNATVSAIVYNPVAGADVAVAPTNLAWSETETDVPVGNFSVDNIGFDACDLVNTLTYATIGGQLHRGDWPVGFRDSRIDIARTAKMGCVSGSHIAAPTVTQVLTNEVMLPTSVTIRYTPHVPAPVFGLRIEYKPAAASTWTTVSMSYPGGSAYGTQLVQIPGLQPGAAYHVRCVNVQYEATFPDLAISQFATCYTRLPVPGLSAATNGSGGSPSTNLTLTPACFGIGYGIQVYDAREDFAGVAATPDATPVIVNSTVGTAPNRWYARTFHASWPEGYQHSAVVTADTVDPETVSP